MFAEAESLQSEDAAGSLWDVFRDLHGRGVSLEDPRPLPGIIYRAMLENLSDDAIA